MLIGDIKMRISLRINTYCVYMLEIRGNFDGGEEREEIMFWGIKKISPTSYIHLSLFL